MRPLRQQHLLSIPTSASHAKAHIHPIIPDTIEYLPHTTSHTHIHSCLAGTTTRRSHTHHAGAMDSSRT
ncbi:MAG TPA: hypothetical protein DCE42_20120 [Myxococcales bacterium]|nr:hypothetical protein [Deltaproteobacteria bacterium]MBU51244.1 hypothetical protein [Deltaproteobacteria bacterium]HAA57083.1 hypothetical protein [Myxococcales bacterium]